MENERCRFLTKIESIKDRLENFYLQKAPYLLSRIPYILEAYQESPDYLFGDLDRNFKTNYSTKREKKIWKKENLFKKKIRVKLAQDYIYRSLSDKDFIFQSEISNYDLAKSY